VLAAAWDIAGEGERKAIAPLVVELIDRAQEDALDRDPHELGDAALIGRLLRAMDHDQPPPLLAQAQVVWRRIGHAALRYDPELLTIALCDASDRVEARRRLEEYLSGRTEIEARLEVLRALGETERSDLVPLLAATEEGTLRDFGRDPSSLGRALTWCFDRGAPPRFLLALARTLLAAAAKQPPPRPVAAPLARAIELASRLVNPRTRKKKPRKPRKRPGKRKAPGKNDQRRPPSLADQLGFSFDRRS
jgi:hypothetical protein